MGRILPSKQGGRTYDEEVGEPKKKKKRSQLPNPPRKGK